MDDNKLNDIDLSQIDEKQTMSYVTEFGNRQQKRKRQKYLLKQYKKLALKKPTYNEDEEDNKKKEKQIKLIDEWLKQVQVVVQGLRNTGYKFGE